MNRLAPRARRPFGNTLMARKTTADTTTPLERHGCIWCKREDLYTHPCGVRGEKARVVGAILGGVSDGVVAGVSRVSSLPTVVARVAAWRGIGCRIHTAAGRRPLEFELALRHGATLIEHRPGYQSLITARARADAEARGWHRLALGLESRESVEAVAAEFVRTPVPRGARRLVLAVGSGMTLAGVLVGMRRAGIDLPVLGVVVWDSPNLRDRIYRWAPWGWRRRTRLVPSGIRFDRPGEYDRGVVPFLLDPYYEGKAVSHLRDGDLFWVAALRASLCE